MSDAVSEDLARRDNPSSWAELFRLALPILDHVARGSEPVDWSLGGGTAIALRIAHRVSDDIDIFVRGGDLRALTPFRNPASAALRASVQFPGHYLKLQLPIGEIDFLSGAMLTDPGFTRESFEGRDVALQTCEEVIARKVRYWAAAFKARDVFDLAAVARASTALHDTLWSEVADRLPVLLTAIERHGPDSFARANIRPMRGFEDLADVAVAEARALVLSLLDDKPNTAPDL